MKIVALLFFLASASPALALNLVNTGPDFALFLAQTDKSPDALERNWDAFEAKYQTVFDEIIYQKGREGWEARKAQKRREFFASLPTLREPMTKVFLRAETLTAEKERQFRALFPDLPNDATVIFLPSLGSFNGKVAQISGFKKSPLLIGVDMVAKRKDDIDTLFAHEFFHVYHGEKIPPEDIYRTMASPLWLEGFATYISGVLNPGKPDEILLMDQELAQTCADPAQLSQMAKKFLTILTMDDEPLYQDWFLMSGRTYPKRRGYCLGLKIIRSLAKTYPLKEMVTWGENRFSREIETILKGM